MNFSYNCDDMVEKVYETQRLLSLLFISAGTYASININTPYFHTLVNLDKWRKVIYPEEFSEGFWIFVIDVEEIRDINGQNIKPNLTIRHIENSGYIRFRDYSNFPTYENYIVKPEWRVRGRMALIIFKDGTVKRVPSNFVSLAESIDYCKGVEKIIKIVEEHFIHPGLRCLQRTEKIKMELYERTVNKFIL